MRTSLTLALVLLLSPQALAQSRRGPHGPPPPNPNAIRPGPISRPETPEMVPPETFVAKDIPYTKPPRATQQMDIYSPVFVVYPGLKQTSEPPRPLIVFIHGGGWIGGGK